MYDYMKALRKKFSQPQKSNLELEIEGLHQKLKSQLDRDNRKFLLRLIDCEDALCDERCLQSFISGFSVASNIERELQLKPKYSFRSDEETQAKLKFEDEEQLRIKLKSEVEFDGEA